MEVLHHKLILHNVHHVLDQQVEEEDGADEGEGEGEDAGAGQQEKG